MSAPDKVAPTDSEVLRQRVRLYLYGELSLAERLEIERCRDQDAAFRALVEEEEAFLFSLGGPDLDCDLDSLLNECREGLDRAVASEERRRESSFLERVGADLRRLGATLASRPLAWQPALAALLLLIGFAIGRFSPDSFSRAPANRSNESFGDALESDAGPELTGIEAVRLDPVGGQVQIVFEERRVVQGDSSDPFIKGLLLNTVRGSTAGARLSSLEALRQRASDSDVRQALLRTMLEDENLGVRLAALDTIRDHVDRSDVRNALVQTLGSDPNTGMRVHAVQLLRERPSRELAGPLQELLGRESNEFVIAETQRILHDLGASTEHY